MTGAGPDAGMISRNNTFVCQDCNSLKDLRVVRPDSMDLKADRNKLLEGTKCSNCGGHNFKLWDSEKKPCPKCKDGVMKVDKGGFVISWD